MNHNTAADTQNEAGLQVPEHGWQPGATRCVLLPQQHEALARLEYTVSRERGFALITGPAGSGKTLLLREFAGQMRRQSASTVFLDARGCRETDLLRECCDELGLGCSRDASSGVLRSVLVEAVRGRCSVGTRVVLIIDHVGREDDAVHLVERLLHATTDTGGPTIIAACREPAAPTWLALARDHAEVRVMLPALTIGDTGGVIEALGDGAAHSRFEPQAVQDLHALANGNLHRVNRLWRLAQSAAELEQRDAIDARTVEWAALELPE